MIIFGGDRKIRQLVREIWDQVLSNLTAQQQEAYDSLRNITDLSSRVKYLQEQVSKLEIEKSQKEEQFSRREREIEHKVGLERARQEQELKLATREAQLQAKEENLAQERELFKKEMEFRQERFMKEVSYQRELSEKLLAMLPKMTIKQEIKDG